MKRIEHLTLHVGVPKTGSSLIQRSLRSTRMALRARGIAYLDRREFLAMPDYRAWAAYDRSSYSKDAFFAQLESAVSKEQRRTMHGGRRVVISNESIPGRLQPDYPNPFWPRAAHSIEELLRVLEPEKTSIVAYVRRQDRLLESLYMQRIHTGHTTAWEEFQEITMRDLRVDFNTLLQTMGSVSGVDEIRVRPFEVIGAGGAAFVADFLGLAGLGGISAPSEDGASNPSYTAPAWEAAMVINRHIDDPRDVQAVREFLNRLFPPGDYPKASLLTDSERETLLDLYADANLTLFETYMEDFPADSYSNPAATDELGAFLRRSPPPEPESEPAVEAIAPISQPEPDQPARLTLSQVKAISQPAEVLERRSEEHWTGVYMRRLSPYVTLRTVRLGIKPNLITAVMVLIGLIGAGVTAVPGVGTALIGVILIQVYLLLDCVDGETARYLGQTSAKGVYLDRLGHYVVEASLMIALGVRVSSDYQAGIVVGLLAALFVVLEKVETDLVAVARMGSGMGKMSSGADVPRSGSIAGLRRRAQRFPIHLITHAAEASMLIFLAALADWLFADSPVFSRGLLVVMALVSGAMVVIHLFSIMQSRRLES